jgi:hypothetical protein
MLSFRGFERDSPPRPAAPPRRRRGGQVYRFSQLSSCQLSKIYIRSIGDLWEMKKRKYDAFVDPAKVRANPSHGKYVLQYLGRIYPVSCFTRLDSPSLH